VVGARGPEAAVDEQGDPRAAQQHVDRRRRFVPGGDLSTTYRSPRRCRALRKAISGPVPILLVRRMTFAVAQELGIGAGPQSTYWYTAALSHRAPTTPAGFGARKLSYPLATVKS